MTLRRSRTWAKSAMRLLKRPQIIPAERMIEELDSVAYKDLLSISHAVVSMKNKHGSNIARRLDKPLRGTVYVASRSIRTKKDMDVFLTYVGTRAKSEIKNPLNTGGEFLNELSDEAKKMHHKPPLA